MRCAGAVTAAVAIAACGSSAGTRARPAEQQGTATGRQADDVIDIYSSLPLSGPQATEGLAVQRGIRTGLAALEQPAGHVNHYKVVYTSLNDSTRAGWSTALAASNAETAVRDPRSVLYIGDLNAGATEASLPILNQAGIVQITPGSSYAGLTDSVAGGVTQAGEPDRFYPDGKLRSLLRLMPDEMVQVAAVLDAITKVGPCSRVTAVNFGATLEGPSLVAAVGATAADYAMKFVTVKPQPADNATATELLAYTKTLRADSVGCLVLTGKATPAATTLVRLMADYLPHDPVIATNGYCKAPTLKASGWYCATPVLPLSEYPGHTVYTEQYDRRFSTKRAPSAYGVYGYMAAELAAYAIDGLVDDGTDLREQLRNALLDAYLDRDSQMIGVFHFNGHGDISDHRVGIYRADARGRLQLNTVLSPPKIVGTG